MQRAVRDQKLLSYTYPKQKSYRGGGGRGGGPLDDDAKPITFLGSFSCFLMGPFKIRAGRRKHSSSPLKETEQVKSSRDFYANQVTPLPDSKPRKNCGPLMTAKSKHSKAWNAPDEINHCAG